MVFLIIVEHKVLIIFCNIFLDIIGNITYDWSNIIHKIGIWSSKGEWHIIDKMVWKLLPEFPACASIHLVNYFDKKTVVPKQIFIHISRHDNVGISIYLEDKNKALKRPLKASMLDYTGPDISNPDLTKPRKERVILRIFQFIDSELDKDKNCINYPNETYSSYVECDEKYVYNQFATKYKPVLPFWATKDMKEVTSLG